MTPTVCVFNRTRESFLCLSALAAGPLPVPRAELAGLGTEFRTGIRIASRPGFKPVDREDGVWLLPAPGIYTVGARSPVDLLYLDRGNRVIQLVEHLDPLQMVPVRWRYASVLEVKARTIYSSRTRVGDQLLICAPEEVETHWKEIQERLQVQRAWTKQEVIPCSNG